MKRLIAIIISAALIFTSVPFMGNGYSYAQSETVITNELLDEMAEDWIETCDGLYELCGNQIEKYLKGTIMPGENINFEKGTLGIPKEVLRQFVTEEEYLTLLDGSDTDAFKDLFERKSDTAGKTLKQFFEENATYMICMFQCTIAKGKLQELQSETDRILKAQKLAEATACATIACIMTLEELDALNKGIITEEAVTEKITGWLIEKVLDLYPVFQGPYEAATIVFDSYTFLQELEAEVGPLKAIAEKENPLEDEYEYLNCVANQNGDFTMTFSPSGVVLHKYNGYLLSREEFADLVIPEEGIYGHKVVGLSQDFANGAFYDKGYLFLPDLVIRSITVPSSVTSLSKDVFSNNEELTDIHYNAVSASNSTSLPVIRNCPKLTNLDIGKNVKNIPVRFITNCGLNNIVIPNSVETIGTMAFENALGTDQFGEKAPATLTLGEGVKVIGVSAFAGFPIREVTIPESATQIQGSAFSANAYLERVKYKAVSVENISVTGIFRSCENLTEFEIVEGVKTIPNHLIENCGVSEIKIPDSVTTIGAMAFENALAADQFDEKAPATLDLGAGVQFIGASAFSGYPIREVTIPESATQIQGAAFGYNDQLIKVNYNAVSAYNPSASAIICNCPSFTELRIGKNVKTIPKLVSGCGLNKIVIPDNVTSIGAMAFENALSTDQFDKKAPATLDLGEGVQFIGVSAFNGYPIQEVTIPESVTQLQATAFSSNAYLKKIYYNAISSDTPSMGASISYCPNLEELIIGENVKLIPKKFISDCGIESIIIPKNVQNIGYNAIGYNPNLKSVTILNKDCGIFGINNTIDSNVKIYGYENSTAHTYAKNYGREFEAIKCEHEYALISKTDATCTAAGSEKYICSTCGKENIVTKDAMGHGWNKEFTVDKAPTCTETGSQHKICDCGEVVTETIPPIEHPWEKSYTLDKAATTSKEGYKSIHCTDCNATKDGVAIEKIAGASLSTTAYTYDGKTKTPTVTVYDAGGNRLVNGADYTVKYASGRKKIDKYKVAITFKGNYSGSKNLYFTIGPKNPKSVKTVLYGHDDVKVSWSKVSGANAYQVYYKKSGASSYKLLKTTKSTSYKKSGLADGTKYYFKVVAFKTVGGDRCYNAGKASAVTTLKKITSVKAKKSGSKVKVSWTNIAGESGYQISKSTSKSKTGTITTYKTTKGKSKTISATKGKTYYYKVRAYKTVGDKKIYGPWSSVVKYKR